MVFELFWTEILYSFRLFWFGSQKRIQILQKWVWNLETGSENGYGILIKGYKVSYFDGYQADLVTSKGFCAG